MAQNDRQLIERIQKIFLKNAAHLYNYKQISAQLGLKDKTSKNLIAVLLRELQQSKYIKEVKLGKYRLSSIIADEQEPKKYITGTMDLKQSGKGYVITEELEQDIFIASNNTYNALNGDKVKVLLFPLRKGRKPEGQVVEVIERKKIHFVGVLEVSQHFAFLIPDNKQMPVDIMISLENLKEGKNGDKAVVAITDWPQRAKNPYGTVVEVLGKPGEHHVEMHAILAEYDFPVCFPKQVEEAAEHMEMKITEQDIRERRDFRGIVTFTIDPVDAKDFDDALSFKQLENGHYEVGVHIADVSHYVKEGSVIDKEGFKRATSVYLVDRCVPMLPERLSNYLCSLRPDEDKFCFSAVFEMDAEANVLNEWYGRTIIRSIRRFAYEEVQEIIEKQEGELLPEINILNDLAKKMRTVRFAKGAINFHTTEVKFNLDSDGKPLGVILKESKDAHKLIEDFMLLANKGVASLINKTKKNQQAKAFVYRIHNSPADDKLMEYKHFIEKMGYRLNINGRKQLSKSFNDLLEAIKDKPEEYLITDLAIRTMDKARYSTKNIGHYGLAFDFYTHFTSPIRRYPDLMVHRLLERYLSGKSSVNANDLEEKCKFCTDQEIKATKAERDSVKYKQVEFMQNKLGQTFTGVISGVSKWGVYVELRENKCEGLVSLRDMEDDHYYLDEDKYSIVGQRWGRVYRLGDIVEVTVKSADLHKKQLNFLLV